MRKLIFRSESGLSMMEGIVSIGVFGLVAAGGLFLSGYQKKTAQMSGSDINSSLVIYRQYLSSPTICNANLLGKMVLADGGSPGKSTAEELSSLKTENGVEFLKVGDVIEEGRYKVKMMKIGKYDSRVKRTLIQLFFEDLKGLKAREFQKNISVFSTIDSTGTIVACPDPRETSLETLYSTICYDADPNEVGDCEKNYENLLNETKRLYCDGNPARPFLAYDPLTKKCKPLDAGKVCGTGYLKGYDNNGNLICVDQTVSVVTPPPPTGDCSPSDKSWSKNVPAGTATCYALVPAKKNGESIKVSDTTGPATGSRTYTCTNGKWVAGTDAACTMPCATDMGQPCWYQGVGKFVCSPGACPSGMWIFSEKLCYGTRPDRDLHCDAAPGQFGPTVSCSNTPTSTVKYCWEHRNGTVSCDGKCGVFARHPMTPHSH